jgi:hypothetical protein
VEVLDLQAKSRYLREQRRDSFTEAHAERFGRNDALRPRDVFCPLKIRYAGGLNLELFNLARLVAFKEREIQQFRAVACVVGTDAFAETCADDGLFAERRDKLRRDQQRAPDRLAFAAAGNLEENVASFKASGAQVGDGGSSNRNTPVAVSGLSSGVVMVAAGSVRARVVCCGYLWVLGM